MKSLCWLLCCVLAFSSGCRKKRTDIPASPADSTTSASVEATASAPVSTPPIQADKPAISAEPAISGQHFRQLTEALLKFKRDKQRGPKNWDELVETGYLKQMPKPPTGYAYVYDRSLFVRMVPAQ